MIVALDYGASDFFEKVALKPSIQSKLQEQLAKKRERAEDPGSVKLVEKGLEKINEYLKSMARNGVLCTNDPELIFYVHLSLTHALKNPVLHIKLHGVELEFEEYIPQSFPKNFSSPVNYSNRGFINTEDMGLLVDDIPRSLSGVSAQTLGIASTTLSPVSGSQVNQYRLFNYVINGLSVWFHLKRNTPSASTIKSIYAKVLGTEYTKNLDAVLTMPTKISAVDGLSKQILIPHSEHGYLSVSPSFNHNIINLSNKLKYAKGKLASFTKQQIGGNNPHNVSYQVLLDQGELNQLSMRFPEVSNKHLRKQYVLATQGILDIQNSVDSCQRCIAMHDQSGINQLVKKLEERIAYYLVSNVAEQLLLLNESDIDVTHATTAAVLTRWRDPRYVKTECRNAMLDLILKNLREHKQFDASKLLSNNFKNTLEKEIMAHV